MASLRRKRAEAGPQGFEFTEAICVEGFSDGWSDPVPRGRVYPRDHWLVTKHPGFWRLLGPQPDEEVNDAA